MNRCIFHAISNYFERLLDTQNNGIYENSKLSPLFCGFREGYNSTQHLMVRLIALDKAEPGAVLLMNLSKAYK